ncbi:phosphopantetheine-binding protein, partial [Streptomyces sp. NPDC058877]|uniref:phosphopantetheine-binding protein n=1 Tax=Streptomyces sp. NPDC058877 TaxID=3346665 RepID=UPI0036A078A3
ATQVATRITQTFKINCPVRTIFENPTIHQLAHEVEVLVTADVTGLPVDDVRGMLAARSSDTARPA